MTGCRTSNLIWKTKEKTLGVPEPGSDLKRAEIWEDEGCAV